MQSLPRSVYKMYSRRGPSCPLVDREIQNLDDYLRVLESLESSRKPHERCWFRGHSDHRWKLVPSALRYGRVQKRNTALALYREFRRHAEDKMEPVSSHSKLDDFEWMQRAQHYGLPTRLLDWTESEAVALYFACLRTDVDGLVCVINPSTLNRQAVPLQPRPLDPEQDEDILGEYMKLSGATNRGGLGTVAVIPAWNNPRIRAQHGTFTLHGSRKLSLDTRDSPSLLYVPIRRKYKCRLLADLNRMNWNEMSLFPEPDKICRHLRQVAKLD